MDTRQNELAKVVTWVREQLRFIEDGATVAPSTERQIAEAQDEADDMRGSIRAYLDKKEGVAARSYVVAFALARRFPDAALDHRTGTVFALRMLGISSGGSGFQDVLSYWVMQAEHEARTGVPWMTAAAKRDHPA
jgi:hypothetical protein